MKESTTITVDKDTRKELMLFKIHSNAKNLDSVIRQVIQKLKEELEESETPPAFNSKEESK